MKVQRVDLNIVDLSCFKAAYAGCVILTHDDKLLLQDRGEACKRYPCKISMFGGRINLGETPTIGLTRELEEELGAVVPKTEFIFLGAITEAISRHTEIVYEYFWHDLDGRIQGCYEENPCYFNDVGSVLKQEDKLMDDVIWALAECEKLALC